MIVVINMKRHLTHNQVKDQEVEHENKMEKARKRMEEALKKSTELAATHMTEMLLHIYIHSKDNQVFTMKVSPQSRHQIDSYIEV